MNHTAKLGKSTINTSIIPDSLWVSLKVAALDGRVNLLDSKGHNLFCHTFSCPYPDIEFGISVRMFGGKDEHATDAQILQAFCLHQIATAIAANLWSVSEETLKNSIKAATGEDEIFFTVNDHLIFHDSVSQENHTLTIEASYGDAVVMIHIGDEKKKLSDYVKETLISVKSVSPLFPEPLLRDTEQKKNMERAWNAWKHRFHRDTPYMCASCGLLYFASLSNRAPLNSQRFCTCLRYERYEARMLQEN